MFVGEVKNKIKMVYNFCKNNNYKLLKIILKDGSEAVISLESGLIYGFTEEKEIEFKSTKGNIFLTLKCLNIQDIVQVSL